MASGGVLVVLVAAFVGGRVTGWLDGWLVGGSVDVGMSGCLDVWLFS